MPKLAAVGVHKTYATGRQELEVLAGVDLHVATSEFVSIVGPSGCGKSTLLKILCGLTDASAGDVLLDGASPPHGLLGLIGHMPQKDLLLPWRRVIDNVTVGLELAGVTRKDARERAVAQLDRFGLSGFERAWPTELSGGMRQRAALLRTFLTGQDVILLDEPFGSLDALTRQTMQQWLLEVWKEEQKTIIAVTHDIDEALLMSDRVYVMGARPSQMLDCVEVRLPRPRTPTSPEFVALKTTLMEPVSAAVLAQQRSSGVPA